MARLRRFGSPIWRDKVRRRDFLGAFCGAAAWPLVAYAQRRPIPRIGLVSIGADPANPANFLPFLEQFRALGYVEGQNVALERRFAAGRDELLAGFVADLVEKNVDVIVTTGGREAAAARRATASIPIVTMLHPDLVGMGFAQSLAKPGGNVTGLTIMEAELDGKRIEMLKQAVPGLHSVGLMIGRTRDDYGEHSARRRTVEAVARLLGVSLVVGEYNMDTATDAISAIATDGSPAAGVLASGNEMKASAHDGASRRGKLRCRMN